MSLRMEIIILLATYVVGSIPVGYLMIRSITGQNILELGSGTLVLPM